MQFLRTDQQDVSRHYMILSAFNGVGHVTGDQKVQFMEIMVV